MNKRDVLVTALSAAAAGLPGAAIAQGRTKSPTGPALLTVSGLIGAGNRGPLDPALDQLMVKQKVAFSAAYSFDFVSLTALPSISISPTLEYDKKQHTLSGPPLVDAMKVTGAKIDRSTNFLLRAIDGYAVVLSASEALDRRFILATHLDGRPMGLGGLGPVWSVYDADRFPDMAAKPVNERFSLCPWATYHIEVRAS
jgi:hypothetical protein